MQILPSSLESSAISETSGGKLAIFSLTIASLDAEFSRSCNKQINKQSFNNNSQYHQFQCPCPQNVFSVSKISWCTQGFQTQLMKLTSTSSSVITLHSISERKQGILQYYRPPNEMFKIWLSLVLFTFCTCYILRCLVCIVVSCLVCVVVVVLCVLLLVVLCVLLSSYVCLLYHVCIAVFTLEGGLLASSQYPEGPATGHLNTGFSRFPCVYKQMLRRFPTFQVATTCFSCSPPDLNLLVTNFIFCIHVK